ncbi:MAG TPA: cupin domain-containing protein [Candidatus Cybelea sp.]
MLVCRSAAVALLAAVVAPWIGARAQSSSQPAAVATPQPGILDVVTGDLPKTSSVAVEIRKGKLAVGAATIWHTHPTPIFVYVESGTGRWEYKAGASQTRGAGEAIEEPANAVTRIVNSGTSALDLIIFQVSKPGAPVLIPLSTQDSSHGALIQKSRGNLAF